MSCRSGTCYIFPLLGAFLADSYWGRYFTIIIFSVVYLLVRKTLLCLAAAAAQHCMTCRLTVFGAKSVYPVFVHGATHAEALGSMPCRWCHMWH